MSRSKVHYLDLVVWPDGVARDIPTCMAERQTLPEGSFLMTDNTADVTCKKCWNWIRGMRV